MAKINPEMENLASQQERQLMAQLSAIFAGIASDPKLLSAVQGVIERRDLAAALELVPFETLSAELKAAMGPLLIDTVGQAARLADLPKKIAVQMRFDVTNPDTLKYVQTMGMSETLRITTEVQEAVRDAIYRALPTAGIRTK